MREAGSSIYLKTVLTVLFKCVLQQKVSDNISLLWVIFEPLLFGLIGADVDFQEINPDTIGTRFRHCALLAFTLKKFFQFLIIDNFNLLDSGIALPTKNVFLIFKWDLRREKAVNFGIFIEKSISFKSLQLSRQFLGFPPYEQHSERSCADLRMQARLQSCTHGQGGWKREETPPFSPSGNFRGFKNIF